MTRVTGGCHCGAIRFEAEGDFSTGIQCNCSHCDMKGFVLAFVPGANFSLTKGEDAFSTYHFNKATIDHKFCKTCGVESFATGTGREGEALAAINLRCVDDFDRESLNIQHVNGKEF